MREDGCRVLSDTSATHTSTDRITLDLDNRSERWMKCVLLPRLRKHRNVCGGWYRRSSAKGWHAMVILERPVKARTAFNLRKRWFDDKVRIKHDRARARGSCPPCTATGLLWDEKNGRTTGAWIAFKRDHDT